MIEIPDIAKRHGLATRKIRQTVRRLRGRINNVGKGGRYRWPSWNDPEVEAIEKALETSHAPITAPEFHQLTIRLPKDMQMLLRTVADATGTSVNDTVVRAIADYLSDEKRRAEVTAYIDGARERFRATLDKLKDLEMR
jgi:uncharacterized protein (DUF1778 family)